MILAGKLVIRALASPSFLRNYSGLSHEDLAACVAYTRDVLRSEKVHPSTA